MAYTKEINRSLRISEDDEGTVAITQANQCTVQDDIVLLDEEEAIEVYRFLHRKFGGQ